ncbi:hypothetical protein RSOLAG22IIIB_10319 [Rhizoctonia solani]|uniref:Uncharacterized protein n=1 Tax=Rhizoctonia solani TaxID=456999 RepID=A0A0K6G2S9_9AGAM|nr:hypothetical protein RSOLAG22IIIB_10319 [Rhizoctonia solani]
MATLSSFVSATWGGADRFSNKAWSLWGFIELGFCTLPIVNLIYATFFLIFIPKVILEWRLGIRIPLRMEYACVGLALCAQLVAIVLTNVANPNETIWSDWGVIYSLSVMSLIALSTYSVSVLFGVPNKRDSTHMSFKQPLLPFCSDNQPGNSKYGC